MGTYGDAITVVDLKELKSETRRKRAFPAQAAGLSARNKRDGSDGQ